MLRQGDQITTTHYSSRDEGWLIWPGNAIEILSKLRFWHNPIIVTKLMFNKTILVNTLIRGWAFVLCRRQHTRLNAPDLVRSWKLRGWARVTNQSARLTTLNTWRVSGKVLIVCAFKFRWFHLPWYPRALKFSTRSNRIVMIRPRNRIIMRPYSHNKRQYYYSSLWWEFVRVFHWLWLTENNWDLANIYVMRRFPPF